MPGSGETIAQAHRDAAAAALRSDRRFAGDPKAQATATAIATGRADDHPAVQSAAFHAQTA